ncbi:MAG: hypothetical protein H6811_09485 [Phycisphaeraceae bacterium]|nr:hypothetical protein [Phycisphaeraceae bacterium]
MVTHRSGRVDAQLIGFLLAVVTAVASLGIMAVYLMRGPSGSSATVPDIGEAPEVGTLKTNTPGTAAQVRGSELAIQFTDRDDPTRLAGDLRFSRLDPLPNRTYRAEGVRGWVFLESGEFLHVRAPNARLVMPDGKRPDSGSLSGGVEIDIYDPPPFGRRPDPAIDTPRLRAKTQTLHFDLATGEASAPGDVWAATENLEFVGSDAAAVFDEVQNRAQFLTVKRSGRITYFPGEGGVEDVLPTRPRQTGQNVSRAARGGNAARPGDSTGETAIELDPESAVEEEAAPSGAGRRGRGPARTHYRASFQGDVVLTQGDRRVEGDQLEVWVRLIDNKLPPGALGRERRSAALPPPAPSNIPGALASWSLAAWPSSAQPVGPEPADANASPTVQQQGEDPVILTWSGPLIVRPMEQRPEELRVDHVAARMSALASGLVRLIDGGSGGVGRCATLDYFASRREIAFSGPGPSSVTLEMPGSGAIETHRVRLSLETGVVSIPGPGVATSRDEDPEGPMRQISWNERADLRLAMRDDTVLGALEWARLVGGVRARDGLAELSGRAIEATFYPPGDDDRTLMRRLDIEGPVSAADGKGAMLLGDRLTANFRMEESGDRSNPELVTVAGHAMATRDGAELRAGLVDATLGRNERDEVSVRFVSAREDVVFTDVDNNVRATADRIRANADLRLADLEGERVVIAQGRDSIEATQVHLNGEARVIDVFGAGTFERRAPEAAQDSDPIATSRWTKQMTFDDRRGTLDCYGDAFARWTPEPMVTDDVTAERVHVRLTPFDDEPTDGSEAEKRRREVLEVRAVGMAMLETNGAPAVVQSVRERPGEDGPIIERLLRLEAPEAIADNTTGQLRVDRPGRLVVADFRESAGDPEEGFTARDVESMRGSAMFRWEGALLVDRAARTIDMTRSVTMTHLRPDGQKTDLVCEHVRAAFEGGEDEQSVGRLVSVEADGAVYVTSGERELVADALSYDAQAQTVEARASEGGAVTFFDAATGAPVSARVLWWDLATDRIEIREPGSVVAPR